MVRIHTWPCCVYALPQLTGASVAGHITRPVASRFRRFDAGWSTSTSAGQAAVSAQRRCTIDLFGEEVRPGDATSARSSLVTHARAYRVPARCARIPLSTWLGAFVPRRRASSRRRHRLTTAATVSLDVYAHRSTNTSYHRRRSRLSCRRRSCLERTVT